MNSKKFANFIVKEIVDKNPPDSRRFISCNRINVSNLHDKDEIWKVFVRYNLDAYGIRFSVVSKYWNQLHGKSLIKQRSNLIKSTKLLKDSECYSNFTYSCPVMFKQKNFVDNDKCHNPDYFDQCPFVNIIKEFEWHKAHYKIARIIVEDVKRLLIENSHGKIDGNLNYVVNGLLTETNDNEGKTAATQKLLSLFDDMKGYGTPPKVITWFFSELSSPVNQVNHFPDLDYNLLTPVDIHVHD